MRAKAARRPSSAPRRPRVGRLSLERADGSVVARAMPIAVPTAIEPCHLRALTTAGQALGRELAAGPIGQSQYARGLEGDSAEVMAITETVAK